jgi:hypothetical protein
MPVKLLRISQDAVSTLGILSINGKPIFTTLELPWKDNQQSISCIPEGEYVCSPHYSKRFGSVFKVFDVPGRFDILFHVGNYPKDTHGCILVGKSFRLNDRGEVEISSSKIALDEMKILLGKESKFLLNVVNSYV